jgi:hypothetical protein
VGIVCFTAPVALGNLASERLIRNAGEATTATRTRVERNRIRVVCAVGVGGDELSLRPATWLFLVLNALEVNRQSPGGARSSGRRVMTSDAELIGRSLAGDGEAFME